MTTTALSEVPLPPFGATGDQDPYPYYDALRAQGPVVWDQGANAWLVTGYEECRRVEIDEEEFRHPYADASQTLVDIKGGRRNITILQGDEHARMHLFLMQLFSPKLMEHYRAAHIGPVLDMLLDRILAQGGKVDLVATLAAQLPPRVLMSMFAMDWRDDALAARVLDLHETVMAWIGLQNRGDEATVKARAAGNEISAILAPYLAARQANPGDDLISRVWLEGPATLAEFTEADAMATTREMFLAGVDTTVHALSNALYILLSQPQVMARVRKERGRTLEAFVEEALRLYGSVQYRFRIANADCRLGGVDVGKDQVLILINAAANRDPAHYGCPAGVDLDRRNARDHLAFNVGPRTCIGAALARAEMFDALDGLLDRTRDLRLDPAAEPPRMRFHYTRSFRPLNVLFERA